LVFVTLPTCPRCGGTKYRTRRSADNGDGSRTKLAVCEAGDCGQPFKIVAEFPEFGNMATPIV
jgi:predicted  nucleic acid-binding Zn-ribbon protein